MIRQKAGSGETQPVSSTQAPLKVDAFTHVNHLIFAQLELINGHIYPMETKAFSGKIAILYNMTQVDAKG